MLSTSQIRCHLRRLTYKPGWEFDAYNGRWEGQHIVIRTTMADNNTGEPITLDIRSAIPPMRDFAALEEWLAWRLGRIESHEMREWLKRDGQIIWNPHDNPRDFPAFGTP